MEEIQAVRALASLAHASRLRVFRLLAKEGDKGLPAGRIAAVLDLPAATLSFHLKELLSADLITDRREGRSVIYSINACHTKCLLSFLIEDCCEGRPELCGPDCVIDAKPEHAQ
jgi:DNA-binding transcriptional ArsR family regulator